MAKEFLLKMRRIDPLINAKKSELEREGLILSEIRKEKELAAVQTRENQRLYMEGVDKLNQLRNSQSRSLQLSLEGSLDYVKGKWQESYRKTKELERQEQAQLFHLAQIQKGLKSFENLKEKYRLAFEEELRKTEQKNLDEFALRKYMKF